MLKSDPRAKRGLELVNELEDRIEKIKHEYDIYFSGVSHLDPTDKKVAVRRIITRLNELRLGNPALRFRFQSLVGRFVSLNQYWTRIMRDIGEGRYSRDIFRANLKNKDGQAKAYFGKEAPVMPDQPNGDSPKMGAEQAGIGAPQLSDKIKREDIEMREISEKELRSIKTEKIEVMDYSSVESFADEDKAAPVPAPPKPVHSAVDRLVEDYSSAQKRRGATPATPIERDTMKRQIEQRREKLQVKYGKEAEIDFRVSEKDGKVSLKPVIRKKK